MPILADDMDTHATVNPYGFSAKRIDKLTATEYTLVAIAVDRSGSISSFETALANCLGEIVKACRRSPRADNLMLRVVSFDDRIEEVHGFKPLSEVDLTAYAGAIQPRGSTALFDATVNAIESVTKYGKDLVAADFACNGIVFVLTDGLDNMSRVDGNGAGKLITDARKNETLESLVSVLIGVNLNDPSASQALASFSQRGGFTQFVDIGEATEKKLARLAEFVSRSISAQSQALGSSGPSQPLSF